MPTRAAIVGAVLGGSAMVVSQAVAASYVEGQGTGFVTNTVSYVNKSFSGASGGKQGSFLQRNDHGDAPVNKMGAQAIVYNVATNGVCGATEMTYNSVTTSFWSASFGPGCGSASRCFSQGQTDAWNGNGYKRVVTKQTPYFDC